MGDHWEPKDDKGPSDRQGAQTGRAARRGTTKTAEGVNAFATKTHLLGVAKRLDVTGRTRMTKAELVDAIAKANPQRVRPILAQGSPRLLS